MGTSNRPKTPESAGRRARWLAGMAVVAVLAGGLGFLLRDALGPRTPAAAEDDDEQAVAEPPDRRRSPGPHRAVPARRSWDPPGESEKPARRRAQSGHGHLARPRPPPAARAQAREPRPLPAPRDTVPAARAPAAEQPEPAASEPGVEPDDFVWSLDREGIRGAMAHIAPLFAECYRAWQKSDPELQGRIVVEYTISAPDAGGGHGFVSEVAVPEDTAGHAFLKGCVRNAVADLRFEAPTGGSLRIRYPLLFRAGGPDEPAGPGG